MKCVNFYSFGREKTKCKFFDSLPGVRVTRGNIDAVGSKIQCYPNLFIFFNDLIGKGNRVTL